MQFKTLVRSFLLLMAFLCIEQNFPHAQIPTFDWAVAQGSISDDIARDVATDEFGSVYVCGAFFGTVDFDPGPGDFSLTSNGGWDIFVQKLDSDGNFLWAYSMGADFDDDATEIIIDQNGDVIVAGHFRETVDFDPGPGTFEIDSPTSSDLFVQKINADGEFIWAVVNTGPNNGAINDLASDEENNIYVVGSFLGTFDFDPGPGTTFFVSVDLDDVFVQKLNSDGELLFARQLGGYEDDHGKSITVGPDNSIYIMGEFWSSIDCDPGVETFELSSTGMRDIFLVKLNSDGDYQWAQRFGGNGLDGSNEVLFHPTYGIYLIGNFNGSVDFDPTGGVDLHVGEGPQDIFVTHLSTLGVYKWTVSIKGENSKRCLDAELDIYNGLYLTGYFEGEVDFDPSTFSYPMTANGAQDIFILKLDELGKLKWFKTLGGPGFDQGNGVTVDAIGTVRTVGTFSDSLDLDIGGSEYWAYSNGFKDHFIHSISQGGLEIESTDFADGFTVFPNPFENELNIVSEGGGFLKVYNSNGNLILEQECSQLHHLLHLEDYPSGLYSIVLIDGTEHQVMKVIKGL